mgnify:FL=1
MSDAKELRAAYLSEWRHCQYTQAIGLHRGDPFKLFRLPHPSSRPIPGDEVEHIWNRRGPLSEHPSNYASVCRAFHLWKHENSVEARIAIMHFKHRLAVKEERPELFDREALKGIAGRDVIGWTEYKLATVDLPTWCERMATELIEAHE